MLHQRIGIFTALPLRSLDQLSLQSKLRDRVHAGRDGQGGRAELMPSRSAALLKGWERPSCWRP